MSRYRIIFLGTPDFAVVPLEALAQDDRFEILKVITQPDKPKNRNLKTSPTPVKDAAIKLGLPVESVENVNVQDFINHIRSLNADAAVVIAFGQIVSQEFMDSFRYKAVNIHGSLLPRWRGAAPIQRAIQFGDPLAGVSLQVMALKLDSGPIIGTRSFELSEADGAKTVYERLKKLSCDLLKMDFIDYLKGHLVPQKQDESLVTIAKKIKKEEGLIDWTRPADHIFNTMRAFEIWPGVWSFHKGKIIKIHQAQVDKMYHGSPGEIIEVLKDSFIVGCGKHSLRIFEVQLESKARQSVETFLRGCSLSKGEFFKNAP